MSDLLTRLEVTPEAEADGEDPMLVSRSDPERVVEGVVEEGVV